ncbi:MAG: PAS domain-containing protein, partial [Candidatus Thermoplasmatota archaeon]
MKGDEPEIVKILRKEEIDKNRKINKKNENNNIKNKLDVAEEKASTYIAYTTYSSSLIFKYINSKYTEGLDYSSKELIGNSILDFIHPDDKKKLKSLIKKRVSKKSKKNKSNTVNFRFKDKTGRWHQFKTDLIFLKEKRNIIFKSKELKQDKDYLKNTCQSEGRIIDNANIWINVIDNRGMILFWNKAAEKKTGYNREEIEGKKKIWDLFYPKGNNEEEIKNNFLKLTKSKKSPFIFNAKVKCKDNSEKNIIWNLSHVKKENKILMLA